MVSESALFLYVYEAEHYNQKKERCLWHWLVLYATLHTQCSETKDTLWAVRGGLFVEVVHLLPFKSSSFDLNSMNS